MICIFFSGTSNTKFIAELFSQKMDVSCFSIEDDVDFEELFGEHDTVAICYPIYGSRVPLIMREFVAQHMDELEEKKLIILVTQVTFSGDGARALCDLFPDNPQVIYAEHFHMPNNICNFSLLRKTSAKSILARMKRADKMMDKVCKDIKSGVIKKKGFSSFSRFLGNIQGKPWHGDSTSVTAVHGTMEYRSKHGIKVDCDCNMCGMCVEVCPMKNLRIQQCEISHSNNCTICYRCVNLCPKMAITTFFDNKPRWQYKGIKGERTINI